MIYDIWYQCVVLWIWYLLTLGFAPWPLIHEKYGEIEVPTWRKARDRMIEWYNRHGRNSPNQQSHVICSRIYGDTTSKELFLEAPLLLDQSAPSQAPSAPVARCRSIECRKTERIPSEMLRLDNEKPLGDDWGRATESIFGLSTS